MIHFKHYPCTNDALPVKTSTAEEKQTERSQKHPANLIIIHGLFGNSDNWHSIAQSLSAEFNIYALDLPNHGQSISLKKASYDAMANLIDQWMQQENITESFVLGHSMGGKVAMQLASQVPNKIQGLLVADIAPVDYKPGHNQIFDGLKAIDLNAITTRKEADSILADYEPVLAIRQFLLKSLIKSDSGFKWTIQIDELFSNYDLIRKTPPLASVYKKPTLFIKGEKSNYIQEQHKDAILHWFPDATVRVIPNTGHWLHAEKPLPFTSLVKRFCNSN